MSETHGATTMASRTPASDRAARTCWQCGQPPEATLFCSSCGALQPFAETIDYFSALGLDPTPVIERRQLEARYYELSRQLHPDRYQTRAPQAQAASGANSALVNRAYRTLRDPVERARYWLQLRGGDVQRQTTVPAALAATVFDVQEQLAELRRAPDAQRAHLVASLAKIRDEIAAAETNALEQLEQSLRAWPAAGGDETSARASLSRILADIAYIRTLLRDINDALPLSVIPAKAGT